MRTRRDVVAFVLIAMLIPTTVWWVVRSQRPAIEAERETVAAHRSTEAPPAPAPVAEPLRTAQEHRSSEVAAQPPAEGTVDPWNLIGEWVVHPERGVPVEGTVIVVDVDGLPHEEEDGQFVPIAWRDDGGAGGKPVPVRAGRFRMHLPAEHDLGVTSLVLGGRSALVTQGTRPSNRDGVSNVDSRARFEITAGTPVHVHARWASPVLLHVIDARSRVELADVTVLVAAADWRTAQAVHPGSLEKAELLAERGESPLELSGPAAGSRIGWQDTVWARVPSYAWDRARVDFERGGEATIELERGADLAVTIQGEIPPPPAVERISYERGELLAVLRLRRFSLVELLLERPPDPRGETLIEGLPPGRFELSLERGRHWDRPLVLAKAPVELVAGAQARVLLSIEPERPSRPRVPIAGTLHLSPEWNCRWIDLRFEPLDVEGGSSLEQRGLELGDLQPVPESPGLYRFRVAPVLPGRYLVKSFSYAFQQLVETGPAGREDVALVIGDPADVVVRLLDADTDVPIQEDGLLLWNCRWPAESTGGGLEDARWDPAAPGYAFRAPAGEIELRVGFQDPGRYETVGSPFVAVQPGPNELVHRVRRSTGFVVALEIDGRRFQGSRAPTVHVESLDGEIVEGYAPIARKEGLLLRVPSGGSWRVVVEPTAAIEPIAPIERTLERGEIRELVIPLVRRE